MYRLLIADDEALEREGLEWIIQRMLPDRFQILHAANGRIAIEMSEEYRPHIIMMDVNMPGIQGLEAIKEIKLKQPEAKFVLVTAYDSFSYAKEALTLGVKEYLVKPAKREQVVTALEQLLKELDFEKRKRTDELELIHKLSQLMPLAENELALMLMVDPITGTGIEQLSEWLSFPLDQGCAIVIAFPEHAQTVPKPKIYDTIRSFAKAYGTNSIVSSLIDRHMAVFLRKSPEAAGVRWKETTMAFGEELCALAARQLDANISIGIGMTRSGADGLRKSYFEAVFASTYYEQCGRVCHFDELKQGNGESTFNSGPQTINPETVHQSYVISAMQRIREQREQQTETVLDRAKSYIQGKYTEDLSLEEVADSIHLNPHYFSKIFKQQVGTTFIDYVTALRINKAKTLMAMGHMSLKEVCFEVGYNDPNYFSRVFKKVTGVTPSDYRNQTR
ncbi:AraC family transcriptional regulator [Paenibacillus alkaliterrae]|uniref:AraC family transcriptional regulator n=1 Tax=Paenibacillus alkaliterrae TaxID=320909 RepID=UPI001F2E85EB|nr:helix-turn-helix domain-containing protein [Paenibacillus alkaliterrae]MCF2939360.1 AraC family transcriptional regulator [Paenibacillus alkaliterrae]